MGRPRAEQDDVTGDEPRQAPTLLDPLWDELLPAEQARIVQLLVERVDVRMPGVEVRLRPNGLAGLVLWLEFRKDLRHNRNCEGEGIR